MDCVLCNIPMGETEGVECVGGCAMTYCDNCWENVEVPKGALDGDHDICTKCLSKKPKFCASNNIKIN